MVRCEIDPGMMGVKVGNKALPRNRRNPPWPTIDDNRAAYQSTPALNVNVLGEPGRPLN